ERGCKRKMKPQEQTYSKSRRLKNQIKAVVTNPYNIIVLIAVVLLVYLIVLPLLDMIATTFELAQRDIRAVGGGKAGDFTLYYWQRLLASELSWTMLIKPLINSLVIGVCVSVCAILLGSILAWLMVRSDLPFKKFFSLAVIIPYMIPSWCKSQAWLSMFKTARLGGAPGFMA
ncbi:Queuosine ECF transporter S component QueT, partial [Dysosmobacter welbionis]